MTDFSVGEAFGAGFRLIRRHPLVPLAWGGVYTLIGILPSMLLSFLVRGQLNPMATATVDPQQAMANIGRALALEPIQIVLSIAASAIVTAAIYRAVMQPENSERAYLRFGAAELWQGLVMACMWVLFIVLVIALAIPAVAIFAVSAAGAGAAGHVGTPSVGAVASSILIGVLMFFAGLALFVWLLARFSMALPMTFATGKFRLFGSWSFTRGRTWPLIGLILLQAVVAFGIYLVIGTVAMVAVIASGGAEGLTRALAAMSGTGSAMSSGMAGLFIGYLVVSGCLSGYIMTFFSAPWADVYRQISPPGIGDHFGPLPTSQPAAAR